MTAGTPAKGAMPFPSLSPPWSFSLDPRLSLPPFALLSSSPTSLPRQLPSSPCFLLFPTLFFCVPAPLPLQLLAFDQTQSSSSALLCSAQPWGVVMGVIPPLSPPPARPELRGLCVPAAVAGSAVVASVGQGWVRTRPLGALSHSRGGIAVHNKQFRLAAFLWGDFDRVGLNPCCLLVCTEKSREKQLLNADHPGFCLQG